MAKAGDVDMLHVDFGMFWFGGQDFLFRVLTRLAVADENSQQQAEDHAQGRKDHGVRNLAGADVQAVVVQVLKQDVVEENPAESHRQYHIRRNQAECQDTGNQAAIQLQLGKDMQQRRDHNRDKRDMDRDCVLRRDGKKH